MSFFGELGRRNVFRVGIAYAIVSWLVVQVADIVFETIGAPEWVMQTLMLGLGLGFLVALIFSWAYEVTPEGVKRESEVDRTQSITGVTGRKLDRVTMGLLVVALAYFVWESRIAGPDPVPVAVEVAPQTVEVTATPVSDLSIAVLPFENRSTLAEDQFFVDGMHDDLLTTLAKIGSMKVISRTSVMEYRDGSKKIPQIAEELGVANILEGGVQRSGSKVRINMQLIDADTDEHLWAEIYDRELSAENLFAIQSEISNAIASALHATLSPEEQESIDRAPTDNLEAFDYYIRGRQLMATREVANLELATQAFLDAVALDSNFALAWVGVADSHSLLEAYAGMPIGSFDDIRRNAVERALAIDDRLGEAYVSLGSIYSDEYLIDEAEQAYLKAIELSPNYATAYHWLGGLLRQNPLRVGDALTYARRAAELDPRSAIILSSLAGSTMATGDFRSALRQRRRLVELFPDFPQAYSGLAGTQLALGDWVGATSSYRAAYAIEDINLQSLFNLAYLYAAIGTDKQLREMLESFGEANSAWALPINILVRAPFDAEPRARELIEDAFTRAPDMTLAWGLGLAATYSGEIDLALEAYSRSYVGDLRTIELDAQFVSDNYFDACNMAWLLLESDGLEARGQELVDQSIAFFENGFPETILHKDQWSVEVCYLLNGETDAALDHLDQQLAHQHFENWHWDHHLPMYDSIREHPRYVAAWTAFEARMTEMRNELRAMDNEKPAFAF